MHENCSFMPPNDQRLKASELQIIEAVTDLGRGPGWVMDFSDTTFSQFFHDELGVNINDPRYKVEGTSKGTRLRYFLRIADPATIHRTLVALWDYRISVPGPTQRSGVSSRGLVNRSRGIPHRTAQTPLLNLRSRRQP